MPSLCNILSVKIRYTFDTHVALCRWWSFFNLCTFKPTHPHLSLFCIIHIFYLSNNHYFAPSSVVVWPSLPFSLPPRPLFSILHFLFWPTLYLFIPPKGKLWFVFLIQGVIESHWNALSDLTKMFIPVVHIILSICIYLLLFNPEQFFYLYSWIILCSPFQILGWTP